MKKNDLLLPALVCAIVFALPYCTLEKEPIIPAGATNLIKPVFSAVEISADTHAVFQLKATLSNLGNLNILQHGWVWSSLPGPALQDDKLELGRLSIGSVTSEITGLDSGKPYYFRPYAITGCDTVYGNEVCSFLGVKFTINTDLVIFQGASVRFTNMSEGANTYYWNFDDDSSSTEASPIHTFRTTGMKTVRLTAENNGCSASRELTLNVIDDPFSGYWVHIQAGSFMMGCTQEQMPHCEDDENPAHPVNLSEFWIGKTEITQKQWRAVTGNNPSYFYDCGDDCPVETVSWNRIKNEFIPALRLKTGRDYRLPTEAEWEYAARGGQPSNKYSGDNNVDSVAWHKGNCDSPHLVQTMNMNGFGLYDMSGNVWEWCNDFYSETYYNGSPEDNPLGPSTGSSEPFGNERVMRGGSWDYNGVFDCRVAKRNWHEPVFQSYNTGFRLIRKP